MFPWPGLLRSTPSARDAGEVADAVRLATMWRAAATGRLDEHALCRRGGFVLEEAKLHAAEGRLEALLFPWEGDRFRIVIDSEPRGGWDRVEPERRAELRRHRLRFRLAHEVGHTLFYDRSGSRPRSVVRPSAAQEVFCDEFARALLVPLGYASALPATADSVVDLHRRFDVSVELACRALARAHRGRLDVSVAVINRDGDLRLQWSSSQRDLHGRLDVICRRIRRGLTLAADITAVELARRRQFVVVSS